MAAWFTASTCPSRIDQWATRMRSPAKEPARTVLTSCSNTTDYQSPRLKIRYRGDAGNQLVHTLNGTAVAVGRMLIAIVENFQQPDGTIEVPEVLRPFVGFASIG